MRNKSGIKAAKRARKERIRAVTAAIRGERLMTRRDFAEYIYGITVINPSLDVISVARMVRVLYREELRAYGLFFFKKHFDSAKQALQKVA